MIAIIRTGGKQYKVAEGDVIEVEKIEGEKDGKIVFFDVLFVGDEKDAKIGIPTVKGAKVEAVIVEQKKGEKVTIIKHKAKKRYLKKMGHRQMLTKVEIKKISAE
ncbi:MAG: 50S ribosomal protein L21 [Patescibacteria group bacterium]|nr:50S ribosomal protein L21 [Patescibacteria group bacterium]